MTPKLEREKFMAKLAAIQEKTPVFKIMADNSLDAILLIDLTPQTLYANRAAHELFGYDYAAQELVGQSGLIFWTEADLPFFSETVLPQVLAGGWNGEVRQKCKDGAVFDTWAVGYPIYDGQNQLVGVSVTLRDITERKQAEESLRLRDQAVQQQNQALLTLAGNSAMYGGDLNTALRLIAETAARAINTRRTSIWFYTEDSAGIRCANLYELDDNRHSTGLVLPAKDYPIYFKALKQSQVILAHDALTDPRTSEFAESYLKPLGISSMLDVPIQVAGQIIGVVCHEHIGPARRWTAEEQSFVTAIAGYVSTVLETYEHKRVEAEQERLQQEIIAAQRRTLQELSTPIIPVMERIIVMPLVGSIDSLRARDITRSLLAGIREHRAKIVILDITGVPLVDSGVASHLNKTIQAARLKGARTIITGVSDAVAETVVDLGIDWSGIETLADLQTGLVTALGWLGMKLTRL